MVVSFAGVSVDAEPRVSTVNRSFESRSRRRARHRSLLSDVQRPRTYKDLLMHELAAPRATGRYSDRQQNQLGGLQQSLIGGRHLLACTLVAAVCIQQVRAL